MKNQGKEEFFMMTVMQETKDFNLKALYTYLVPYIGFTDPYTKRQ